METEQEASMIAPPTFEWHCEECGRNGRIAVSRRGAAVDFLNQVIAQHRDETCNAKRFEMILPNHPLLTSSRWTRAVKEEEAAARKEARAKKKKAAG